MAQFAVTMTYDLDPKTPPTARKLLRAELVGRRWQDSHRGRLTPSHTVWIRRTAQAEETCVELHARCGEELDAAIERVRQMGMPIKLVRAWIHVSGGGHWGPYSQDDGAENEGDPQGSARTDQGKLA